MNDSVDTLQALDRDTNVRLHLDSDETYRAEVSDVLVSPTGDGAATDHILVNIALWADESHIEAGDLPNDDLAVFGSWDEDADPALEVSVWNPTDEDVNARDTLGQLDRIERLEDETA